jgi:signal transduction histidine kinase
MGGAPEAEVGQAPPPRHRPAPVPVREGLRNLAGVGDAPDSQQTSGARDEPGSVPAGSGGRMLAGLRAVSGWAPANTWRATANLPVSLVLGGLFAFAVACALLLSAATVWILGLGTTVRAGALRLAAQMARLDRRRIEWLSGVRIEPLALPRAEPGAGFGARQLAWARSPWLWRLHAYQLVRLPVAGALAFGAVAWWWATVLCFVLAGQPAQPVLLLAWRVGPVTLAPAEMAALVAAGVAGLLAWPAAVRAVPAIDTSLGHWLLGPSRASQLSTEVARLARARSQAVASAEAERRRIERDLHDGLQPQLVNLALDLGLAKARLRSDPAAAQSLIERAHQEAKRAAEDLRNLVRGIHPSVLDERGLDAALSALVAGCTVPVAVTVTLPRRPAPTPEAAAYYVVAEAITNISKHAQAHKAAVNISYTHGALRVAVQDDGRGGARLEPGGGLEGLAARVASLDGTFELSSPQGGPTRIEAMIPCAP